VSLAWLCVFPPVYALAFRLTLRAIGLSYARVLGVLRGPAIAAAIMSLCVAGLQYLANARMNALPVIQLLGLIASGAILYPAALWISDRQAFDLLRRRAQLMISGN
jgi:uncharacterized membrane protein